MPAAAALGDGAPVALAVDAAAPWRPELVDFLRRYQPERLIWVGGEGPPEPPAALADRTTLQALPAASALEAASALAAAAWDQADRVVLYDPADRGAALAAAGLAARLPAPLFPCSAEGPRPALQASLEQLGATRVLWIGERSPPLDGLRVTSLEGAEQAVRWLVRRRHGVDYLAAVNPDARAAGRERRLDLAAPLLAAARRGAVAPLPFATRWKERFDAAEVLEQAPEGAAASSDGWRAGTIQLGERTTPFLTGRDPASGRWQLQLDRNGDGAFDGDDEHPIRTGEDFALGGRRWTADLDADEKARGQAAWLSSPTSEELRRELDRYHDAARGQARYLCLVGWPEALPLAVIDHGQGIDADLVSDLPYAQTDEDPFVELAFARFLAEDLPSATLLACRGFVRDHFPDQAWRGSFATAEWAGPDGALLEAAGLRPLGHHPGEEPIDEASPLTEAELIVHGSHAMWTVLGDTYTWDSEVLLAPALVSSSGCSTASLDQDPEHRSVAARLLRNGAVAFVGNGRRGVAQGSLFLSEVQNALLGGATLGEAQRLAQNRVLVTVMEKGESGGGLHYYQLHHQAAYGDPALQLGLARPQTERPARVEQRGTKVSVHAPDRWLRTEYPPNPEWGCSFPVLYTWSGPGVAIESSWYGPEKRNADVPLVFAEARTRSRATTVRPLGEVEAPLGWTGACFVDEHADGSRSLHWRVRMIDGDMTTGEVRAQTERLDFRLVTD